MNTPSGRSQMAYETISVAPIAGALGAEVSGVDLARKLPDATIAEIRQALLTQLVIFFRNQHPDAGAASGTRPPVRPLAGPRFRRGDAGLSGDPRSAQGAGRDTQFRGRLAYRCQLPRAPVSRLAALCARSAGIRWRHAVRQPVSRL